MGVGSGRDPTRWYWGLFGFLPLIGCFLANGGGGTRGPGALDPGISGWTWGGFFRARFGVCPRGFLRMCPTSRCRNVWVVLVMYDVFRNLFIYVSSKVGACDNCISPSHECFFSLF